MSAKFTSQNSAVEADPTHNDEKAMVASIANLARESIGTAHLEDANATTVCFGTIQEVFTQKITLQQLFAGFDCTRKAPDRSYFDWIAGQFAYVFPKAGADMVRAIAAGSCASIPISSGIRGTCQSWPPSQSSPSAKPNPFAACRQREPTTVECWSQASACQSSATRAINQAYAWSSRMVLEQLYR